VPEKKIAALPSVLDSDAYADLREQPTGQDSPAPGSSSRGKTAKVTRPLEPTPNQKPLSKSITDPGYVLLPDSSEHPAIGFAKDVIEQAVPAPAPAEPPPKEPPPKKAATGKITTARRTRDAVERSRREREERELRAAEAQRHTLALMERRRKRALAVARLVALVVAPLVVSVVFLASTTSEVGFATKGALGSRLGDLGEVVRRGVQGLEALVSGK
jgi:hypothetical protein